MNYLIFVDTETGGLNPKNNTLLTLAVHIDAEKHGEHVRTIYSGEFLIQPRLEYFTEDVALEVNNIDLESHIKNSYKPERVKDFFKELLSLNNINSKNAVFVGQNIPFDIGFLKEHLFIEEKNFFNNFHIQDTKILAKKYLELENYSLGTIAKHYNYETKFHNALNDVLATRHVYYKMREEFGKKK